MLLEEGKCKIESLNLKGLGVGKTELGLVELPYTLPGDVATFERHGYRGKSNFILKGVEEGATPRSIAPCKFFGTCGGCLLQHLTEEHYTEFKLRLATTALAERNVITSLAPMITIPAGKRRRANMEAVKRHGEVRLGFHRFHSHHIIGIDECIAMEPELSRLIKPLKETLNIVMADKQQLQMFITKADNGIDIAIEIQNYTALNQDQRAELALFATTQDVTRLIFRYRKTIDVIREKEKPYTMLGGVPIEIDAYCFLQANKESDKILSDLVLKYLNPQKGDVAADLFCGRGTYTLPLSERVAVDGFESDKGALMSLGKVNNPEISLYRRDLFETPLTQDELKKYNICVINPPRAGAEAQVKELANAKLKRICYISCNPDTFARDARMLIDAGYELKEVTPVDQFYWSPHLELAGCFELTRSFI